MVVLLPLFWAPEGCVSLTTRYPTPYLEVGYAVLALIPCPNDRTSSRSFIFSRFYRGGFMNLWHEQHRQTDKQSSIVRRQQKISLRPILPPSEIAPVARLLHFFGDPLMWNGTLVPVFVKLAEAKDVVQARH